MGGKRRPRGGFFAGLGPLFSSFAPLMQGLPLIGDPSWGIAALYASFTRVAASAMMLALAWWLALRKARRQ